MLEDTKELNIMNGTIRVKVPELLKERKQDARDLLYGARLAPATAYRLAEGKGEGISFEMLASLCNFFKVNVSDILEYVPEEKGS